MLCGPLIALSRETYSPFLRWTPSMEGKQASAHMSTYPLKLLFVQQHSHVRLESEWWEFHRDKNAASLPLFNSLVWHRAPFSRNIAFTHFLLSPPGGERRRSITVTPENRAKFGSLSFSRCQVFIVLEIVEKLKGCSQNVQRAFHLRLTQCNLFFILNDPSSLIFPTRDWSSLTLSSLKSPAATVTGK